MSELLKHIMLHYKWGGKTLYYNTNKDSKEDEELKQAEEICDVCVV